MFVARTVAHGFDCVSTQPGKLLVIVQPAGEMENFFRQLGKILPEKGLLIWLLCKNFTRRTTHQLLAHPLQNSNY